MIKQYFEYKRKKIEKILSSEELTPIQKQQIITEYNNWIKTNVKFDKHRRVIINKTMSNEIMSLIDQEQIPLIMDLYDMAVTLDTDMPNSQEYNGEIFQSVSDIVAIHKSPIPPNNDTIVTQENNKVTKDIIFVDPSTQITHTIPYVIGNDTIHFTLNCPVENHEFGNDWDSYKYAVMISLDKLNKEKILDVKGEDTYLDGNAELGANYLAFCPLGERKNIENANPNATVIEYDGIELNDAIKMMIIYSGKKIEPYGTYGWGKQFDFSGAIPDTIILENLLERENYPNLKDKEKSILHSETKYMARRMWKREYNAITALVKYNNENGIDMPHDVMMMVLTYAGAYSLPGNVPVSVESYKECVIPLLKANGYELGQELFTGIDPNANGIKHIGKSVSPEYGIIVPLVSCPSWELELRNRVIESLQNNKELNSSSLYVETKDIKKM